VPSSSLPEADRVSDAAERTLRNIATLRLLPLPLSLSALLPAYAWAVNAARLLCTVKQQERLEMRLRALWVAVTFVAMDAATPPRPPLKRPAAQRFPPLRLVNMEQVSDSDQVDPCMAMQRKIEHNIEPARSAWGLNAR
jgi:hypothetical protein